MTSLIEFSSITKVVRSKNQVSADLKGDAVIYNFVDGKYFSLNSIGTRIWSLIEQPITITELSTSIQDEYIVEKNQCQNDLAQLLNKLHQSGLVEFISMSDETSE